MGARKKKVTDRCTICNICVKLCPVDNITMDENGIKFGDKCEYCFGCIQFCPQNAIEFGKLKRTEESLYTHPAISVSEMIKRNNKQI
jgi:ferredoxin